MIDIKLNLVVVVPGATMMSEQECSKLLKEPVINKKGKYAGKQAVDKKGNPIWETKVVPDATKYNKHLLNVESAQGTTTLAVFTRKSRVARQSINMSTDAYNYMISNELPEDFKVPADSKVKNPLLVWKSMSKKSRLEWHLARVASDLHGKVESYQVFDD